MDVVASFIARAQSPVLMEPGERAFDYPTGLSQAAAVFGVAIGTSGSMPRQRNCRS